MEKLYSFRNAMMIVAILLVFPILPQKQQLKKQEIRQALLNSTTLVPLFLQVQQPIRRQSAEQQVSRILLVLVC